MNKTFLFLFIFVLMLTSVSGSKYISGNLVELYSISQCQGPIKIKVIPKNDMVDNEIKIEKCFLNNDTWDCKCDNGYFNVKFLTLQDTKNTYKFIIQYYLKYEVINKSVNSSPSIEEIERDNFKRTYKFDNIVINPAKPLPRLFKIDMQTKNVFLFSILVFVFIIGIVFLKMKKTFFKGSRKENNDVMNYKVTKDKDINSDIKDIFNKIK